MMNSGTFAILALTSAILGAVGCGSISADPIEKPSPSELESLSVESNDPYACEVVQTGDGLRNELSLARGASRVASCRWRVARARPRHRPDSSRAIRAA